MAPNCHLRVRVVHFSLRTFNVNGAFSYQNAFALVYSAEDIGRINLFPSVFQISSIYLGTRTLIITETNIVRLAVSRGREQHDVDLLDTNRKCKYTFTATLFSSLSRQPNPAAPVSRFGHKFPRGGNSSNAYHCFFYSRTIGKERGYYLGLFLQAAHW
jgi:hypothetical protein